jgi:hypothetical protein
LVNTVATRAAFRYARLLMPGHEVVLSDRVPQGISPAPALGVPVFCPMVAGPRIARASRPYRLVILRKIPAWLCVPRILFITLTSRLLSRASGRNDQRSCACGSSSS